MENYNCKEYIINRIHVFAQHGLTHYRWNSGIDINWNFKSWNPNFPTDAEVILHLFVTFMNLNFLTDESIVSSEFSKRHFCHIEKSIVNFKAVAIKQISSRPPHLVVIDNGKVFNLPEGEKNVFLAIYVFTFLVFHNYRGYLGFTSLGASRIGLDALLD